MGLATAIAVLASPSRVDDKVTLTWVTTNVAALGGCSLLAIETYYRYNLCFHQQK